MRHTIPGCKRLLRLLMHPQAGFWLQAIPLVMVYFVFYCIVIRPGRAAEGRRYAAVCALVGGELVVTSGGFVARFLGRHDEEYELDLGGGIRVRVLQDGIRDVFVPAKQAAADAGSGAPG